MFIRNKHTTHVRFSSDRRKKNREINLSGKDGVHDTKSIDNFCHKDINQ